MIILAALSLPSNSLETWTVGGTTYSWGESEMSYITNVIDWNGLGGVALKYPLHHLSTTSVTALKQYRTVTVA
jgi:hypothetical protein